MQFATEFPICIISDGQAFDLIDIYTASDGWQYADYYNANGIMSKRITIRGQFVSHSL